MVFLSKRNSIFLFFIELVPGKIRAFDTIEILRYYFVMNINERVIYSKKHLFEHYNYMFYNIP